MVRGGLAKDTVFHDFIFEGEGRFPEQCFVTKNPAFVSYHTGFVCSMVKKRPSFEKKQTCKAKRNC